MAFVLVVDDERSMRDFLKILLEKEGHRVSTSADGFQALAILAEEEIEVVISDIKMPKMGGIQLLEAIKSKYAHIPVVMITAFAAPDDAVQAMRNGAFDYISKPFNVDELKTVITAAITNSSERQPPSLQDTTSFSGIIGQSREMRKIFEMIQRVAPTPANVLIHGESGTGKELVAQAIHNNSKVNAATFVPITCSAIPEDLMESELFGHIKGSFTGAINDKPGLFQEADNGTAFLDEIGELPSVIQTKLLRVLQEREIKPVGGTKTRRINVRIVAATNRILEDEIREKRFREDLYYRLAVVPIRMPPLRERKGDVPLLVNHFLKKYSQLLGKEIQEISSYAMQVLMNYDFPGNVRELENIIERGVALESSNIILPESLSFSGGIAVKEESSGDDLSLHPSSSSAFEQTGAVSGGTPAADSLLQIAADEEELFAIGLDKGITDLEKRLIAHALKKTNNSKMKAAELLKMSFRSFRYKVKKYDIH